MKVLVVVAFVVGEIVEAGLLKKLDDIVPSVLESIESTGDAIWKEFNDKVPDSINPLNLLYTNRCIEDLGCFYTGPPFHHPIQRPISLPPTTRVDEIKFHLFTPTTRDSAYFLNTTQESLQNSSFNPRLETKFIIHGFLTDLGKDSIVFTIKDALLEVQNFNVIIVDWTAINRPPYAQAVANTRVVGAKVAKLINFLINETQLTPRDFHVIGHSLGGQTAGYTGERIPGLGRITGLDPAGPYFQEDIAEVRLDTSDALFVDVIHTDGGELVLNGLGISEPIGHVDFYPNGGRLQAGCVNFSSQQNIVGAAVNFTKHRVSSGCDHSRANEYFLESLNNTNCKFFAVQCSSYIDYEAEKCQPSNATINRMGYYAKKIPGLKPSAKFFLRTNQDPPFCNDDSIYM